MFTNSVPAVILAAILVMSIGAFAIASAQQEEERVEAEVQQVESDGGLTATLNSDSFTTGDTITVNGTVEERNPRSYVSIKVTDPQDRTVERQLVRVGADKTFTYSFVAGRTAEFDPDYSMVESGNYTVTVSYFPPYDIFDKEVVEFVFGYNRALTITTGTLTNGGTTSNDIIGTSSVSAINMTAINQSAAHAMRHTELAYLAIQENDTQEVVLGNLNLVLDALESVQGNLTNSNTTTTTSTTSDRR